MEMKNYLVSLTSNFEMKSSASLDTLEKASSSKSYFPIVTLAIVSISVEPMNGDKPDKLCFNCNNSKIIFTYLNIHILFYLFTYINYLHMYTHIYTTHRQ